MGDEAMLLNAFSRLESYIGPCRFVLLCEPDKPLSPLLPDVETIPSPRLAFSTWIQALTRCFSLMRRTPLLKKLERSRIGGLIWRLPFWWASLKVFLWRSGVVSSPGKNLEPFFQAIRECDVFYAVGAAHFNDFNLCGVAYKSWLYSVASRYTKAAVASSQGIGPLQTVWACELLTKAFSGLKLLSFRDHSLSKSIVEAHEPSSVPNKVVFDEAFTLALGPEAAVEEYIRTSGLPENAPFLAIHFRSTDYMRETTPLLPRISGLLDKIINAHSHYLVFFPMSYHTHSRMDEEFGHAIRARMKRRDRMLVAPLSRDVTIVKGAVARARYSLGLSYHLHIFSLSIGHPAVILFTGEYYTCKSEGLVGFYGPPSAAIDLSQVPDSEILNHLAGLEDNYVCACQAVAKVNEELLKENDWTLRELAGIRDSW